MDDYDEASLFYRANRRFGALRPVSWVLARTLYRIDPVVSRLTNGRQTVTGLLTGLTVATLTTRGARSGLPRAVPLLGFATDDGFCVIASNYAQHSHPAWYYNLLAHPEAELEIRSQRRPVVAHLTSGEQRTALWQRAIALYPGWVHYERRAAHREIGVFLLTAV